MDIKPPTVGGEVGELSVGATPQEMWKASLKELSIYQFAFRGHPERAQVAGTILQAKIANRTAWATWALVAGTVSLVAATIALIVATMAQAS